MIQENTQSLICPICSSENLIRDIEYVNEYWPDFTYFNELSIIGCNDCGCGYSWPELEDKVINEFYTKEYRRKGGVFYFDFDGLKHRPIQFDERTLAQLLLAKQYVTFNSGDVFLDVGPGSGASFHVAQSVLHNPKCFGVEKNTGAGEAFNRVYNANTISSVEEFAESGILATICLFSHSLEHFKITSLEATLCSFKKILAPGGILIIEVPLVDMRKHIPFRREDSPHLSFFSLDGIRLLFEKNNWKVLFLNSCGESYDNWWMSKKRTGFRLQIILKLLKIKKILKPVLLMLPSWLYRRALGFVLKIDVNYMNEQFSYCGDRTCLRIVVHPI